MKVMTVGAYSVDFTYSVNNLGTQLIVCNSCAMSLNAYGISTYAKSVVLSHTLHLCTVKLNFDIILFDADASLYCAIIPHFLHT